MTILLGGHAEVLFHVLAKETEAREIHLSADLFGAHIRLAEQALYFLRGYFVDKHLCGFSGVVIAYHGQVFRRDSQTVSEPSYLTLAALSLLQQKGKFTEQDFLPSLLAFCLLRLYNAAIQPIEQLENSCLHKDAADVFTQSGVGIFVV